MAKWILLAFVAGFLLGAWLGHRAGRTAACIEMREQWRSGPK